MSNLEALHRRAKALNLHGLLARWGEAAAAGWLATLIDWEEQERTRRSLERRLRAAHSRGDHKGGNPGHVHTSPSRDG